MIYLFQFGLKHTLEWAIHPMYLFPKAWSHAHIFLFVIFNIKRFIYFYYF